LVSSSPAIGVRAASLGMLGAGVIGPDANAGGAEPASPEVAMPPSVLPPMGVCPPVAWRTPAATCASFSADVGIDGISPMGCMLSGWLALPSPGSTGMPRIFATATPRPARHLVSSYSSASIERGRSAGSRAIARRTTFSTTSGRS
jgi:hypothetical protein